MARIRTIKPEFWTDEKAVALSFPARLLFLGILNFVDDEGRGSYSPVRLKMQILPADPVDISELLGEIRGNSMIEVYEVDGKEYFHVVNFLKHQKVDKRSSSKIPPPPPFSPESPRIPPTDQGKEGIKEGKGKEGKEEGGVKTPNDEIYGFVGHTIRLKQSDLDGWRKAYHKIPDLLAELQAADAYYTENAPKDGKWYFPVSNWLKREHSRRVDEEAEAKKVEDDIYAGVL